MIILLKTFTQTNSEPESLLSRIKSSAHGFNDKYQPKDKLKNLAQKIKDKYSGTEEFRNKLKSEVKRNIKMVGKDTKELIKDSLRD